MPRLNGREVDAVVDTVIQQIEEATQDSPEIVEYQKNLKLSQQLNKECEEMGKQVVEELMKQYQEEYPQFKFNIYDYYNRIDIISPEKPKYVVNKKDIERELILANISGNIEETMSKIVNKYTNQK